MWALLTRDPDRPRPARPTRGRRPYRPRHPTRLNHPPGICKNLPTIDYTQPATIALHLVEDDHLVTHWRVV
jgi:hypothetical protein